MSKEKKTEVIEKILSTYREKTNKPEDWYIEKFDALSDLSLGRLENYLKVVEKLSK